MTDYQLVRYLFISKFHVLDQKAEYCYEPFHIRIHLALNQIQNEQKGSMNLDKSF
jgi:hypothetical protein